MTVVVQVYLQHLLQFLEQSQGLVDGGMAHGGKFLLEAGMELRRAGVILAGSDQSHQLQPLRCQSEIVLLEQGDHFVEAGFGVRHSF